MQLGSIPDSEQLPSIASLSPTESNTQQGQGELLAKLAASLMSETGGMGSHSSKVVSLGLGMPYISKNWKIKSRLGSMLTLQSCHLPREKAGPCHLFSMAKWCWSRSLTMKDLPDIATQTQCFAMFVRVVCDHQPQQIGDLMTYLSLIT